MRLTRSLLILPLALALLSTAACKGGKEDVPEKIEVASLESKSGEKVETVIPSPDEAFVALDALGKPKWKDIVTPIEGTEYGDESQGALVAGMMLADFFVHVHAKDTQAAEAELDKMIKVAKGLKIKIDKKDADEVRGHLKDKKWAELRESLAELRGKMADQLVEEMKRPDLAYLLSLGAYLEGTLIITKALDADYDEKAAVILRQHQLIKDVREAGSVTKKSDKYAKKVISQLDELEKLMTVEKGKPVSKKDVKKILDLASGVKEDVLK